MDTKL